MSRPPNSSNRGPRRLRWLAWASLMLAVVALGGWALTRPQSQPRTMELIAVARTNLMFYQGRWYQLPETNAFTGWMVEYYPSGSLQSRASVSKGLLNGVSEGWYTNGQMQVREHYKDGISDGLREKWHVNGLKLSQAMIVEGKVTGTFQSWHDNGQLAEQINMKLGQADGTAWAYYPSGFLKAETTVHDGQVLNQKTWNDGEQKTMQ
jgi:hypothetical protein